MMKSTKPAISWRNVLKIHPAAELFPRMSEDELRALGEDIKKHGLRSPIVLWKEGAFTDAKAATYLLDGRNRLDGLEAVGASLVTNGKLDHRALGSRREQEVILRLYGLRVEHTAGKPPVITPGTDPYSYVVSTNINRRHLTADDKRRIIAALIKANPQKSDRQIAKLVDASPTTVGDERKKTCPDLDTSIDTKGRRQPRKKPKLHRGQVLRGKRCHGAADKPIAGMEEIDPKNGRAKALALIAGVPREEAIGATRETVAAMDPAAGKPKPRDDIGLASAGEIERLRARNEVLEREVARLERENIALRSQVEELRARPGDPRASLPELAAPLASDDPGPIPACLLRKATP